MFLLFRKRVGWNRRTRWTPLLQNQREFQRALTKERSRVDRSGSKFGFIILRLSDLAGARAQTVKVAKILHARLRDTDEKGHLGYGRLGVVLPETGAEESEFVLCDILKLAGKADLQIEGEAFVYPDPDTKHTGGTKEAELDVAEETADVAASTLAMMLPEYPSWKRALDVSGAVVGLALSAPVLLVLSAIVKASTPGPVLFRQRRTGFLGKPFTIYKLRTMIYNAEDLQSSLQEDNERDGPAFKMREDPRITRFGKFLRATGLDELPQLYNVLIGDMSLVGPRPLPVAEAAQCSPWQKRRQEVRPGLTCFWQLAKSRKVSFADWMRLDRRYAGRTSIGLDVKLIAKTFSAVFLGRVGH